MLCVKHRWNGTGSGSGKSNYTKRISVPLCRPQIPAELDWHEA